MSVRRGKKALNEKNAKLDRLGPKHTSKNMQPKGTHSSTDDDGSLLSSPNEQVP